MIPTRPPPRARAAWRLSPARRGLRRSRPIGAPHATRRPPRARRVLPAPRPTCGKFGVWDMGNIGYGIWDMRGERYAHLAWPSAATTRLRSARACTNARRPPGVSSPSTPCALSVSRVSRPRRRRAPSRPARMGPTGSRTRADERIAWRMSASRSGESGTWGGRGGDGTG